MNMYAKHVKELNLPKIEEGSPPPPVKHLPNRFEKKNHLRLRSINATVTSPTGTDSTVILDENLIVRKNRKLIWEMEKHAR
jgi:hypothetical protein